MTMTMTTMMMTTATTSVVTMISQRGTAATTWFPSFIYFGIKKVASKLFILQLLIGCTACLRSPTILIC